MRLSETTVDALLDRLSGDDDFRARFQQNPREATRSLGTADPAVDTLPDAPLKALADKDAIGNARGHLRRQLVEAMAPFNPVTLDIPRR